MYMVQNTQALEVSLSKDLSICKLIEEHLVKHARLFFFSFGFCFLHM